MKFELSVDDNFSSIIDESTGLAIFVESFDNVEFSVCIGSVSESKQVAVFTAFSSNDLNEMVERVYMKFVGIDSGVK